MCPFDDVADLNTVRREIIARWYEEQQLRDKLEAAEERERALLAQLADLELRLRAALAAKNAGAKTGKNKSERRRTGTNTKPPKSDEAQTGHGPTEQPHLEQQEKVFDLDEPDKVCPSCGGELREWVGHDDTSVLIEVVERRFVCQQIRQKKYRCGCGNCLETAPGPERLIKGGRYSVSFAIEVAYDKYMLHSPLERQAREMTRQGLVVDSQTLWDQLWALSRLYVPAYEALHRYVLSHDWVAADETTWMMLRHAHAPASLKQGEWYVWIAHRPDAAFYLLRPERDDDAAKELLSVPLVQDGAPVLGADGKPKREPYRGKALVDGWWAYKIYQKHHPGVVLVHCWSHVRREFLACGKSFPNESGEVLDLIAELYVLEREAPAGREGDAARLALRRTRSSEVLERIGAWVFANALSVPKESDLRKAAQYMVNHWQGLTEFVKDPELPLDNNAVECDCRQCVQGKKNHHGSRSERGTEVAQILYTLVQSAKLAKVEPKTYLRLAALRQMRGQAVVLPHEVTAEHLRDDLALSDAEIERVLARRQAGAPRVGPAPS